MMLPAWLVWWQDCGLGGWGIGVWFWAGTRDFSLPQNICTCFGAHSAFIQWVLEHLII